MDILIVAIPFIGLVVGFNVWNWKRRSKMTLEERAAEDDENSLENQAW